MYAQVEGRRRHQIGSKLKIGDTRIMEKLMKTALLLALLTLVQSAAADDNTCPGGFPKGGVALVVVIFTLYAAVLATAIYDWIDQPQDKEKAGFYEDEESEQDGYFSERLSLNEPRGASDRKTSFEVDRN
eukprot:gb/GECG01014956.1/.p1 GENE.gb/GECG01014956.1/~~gb/GECG01014956.1/.p1  ORF type:complete len:130 (+),score=15.01 gb/GECG01014956.1/:1-390(+)